MRYSIDPERHAKLFGPKDDLGAGPGRSRRCRSCGGWHRLDQPWPHNCRPPAPPRNPDLATPQIAPSFDAFRTGVTDDSAIITSRNDKREYMKRHDLVEYDEGVTNAPTWVEEKEREREVTDAIRRFRDTDTEYYSPELKATPLEQAAADPEMKDSGDIAATPDTMDLIE